MADSPPKDFREYVPLKKKRAAIAAAVAAVAIGTVVVLLLVVPTEPPPGVVVAWQFPPGVNPSNYLWRLELTTNFQQWSDAGRASGENVVYATNQLAFYRLKRQPITIANLE